MPEPALDVDRPSPLWRATLAALARLPQGLLSRAAGALADIPLPRPLRRPVLGAFARITGIDVGEAQQPLIEYRSVNAFFVRRLAPGARSWSADPEVVSSPVDGVLGRMGRVRDGTVLQAKGRSYDLGRLLGDAEAARGFEGGAYFTIYLSPRHYHRIHAPVAGAVVLARHCPGGLLPVNAAAVAHVPDLFVRNERVTALLETAVGPVALVAVGAYNVGRISTAFDPEWSGRPEGSVTNRRRTFPAERRYDPPIPVHAGDDFMAFHLGSTVVLLTPPGTAPAPGVAPGLEVRAGAILASPAVRGHVPASDPDAEAQ
jgi:phosphatidylserine decarboxylase